MFSSNNVFIWHYQIFALKISLGVFNSSGVQCQFIDYLLSHGHEVLNLNLVQFLKQNVHALKNTNSIN